MKKKNLSTEKQLLKEKKPASKQTPNINREKEHKGTSPGKENPDFKNKEHVQQPGIDQNTIPMHTGRIPDETREDVEEKSRNL